MFEVKMAAPGFRELMLHGHSETSSTIIDFYLLPVSQLCVTSFTLNDILLSLSKSRNKVISGFDRICYFFLNDCALVFIEHFIFSKIPESSC